MTKHYTNEGVLLIRNSDIKDGRFEFGANPIYLEKEFAQKNESRMHQIGDVITVHTGDVGTSAVITENEENSIGFATIVTRPNTQIIDSNYFCTYLNTEKHKKWAVAISTGDGRTNYNLGDYYELIVPVPTIEEQKKIATYIQSLNNLITLHQRNDEYLCKLNFSLKIEGDITFTNYWEQRKLGSMVIDHNAGIYISKEDYGSGTNVIGVGNIYDNDIFDGEIYRFGPVNDDRFLLEENDLIYGESSLVPEGIARTVCVGKNGVGSAFAWHTRRVKLDQNIVNSHFATLELNYNTSIRKYLMSVSTQTALTGMTTEGYFGVTLMLPSVKEQASISDFFKNLDHLITLHQRKLFYYKKEDFYC